MGDITLVLGIIFLLLLIGVIIYIKNKVTQVSRAVFGTESLVEGLKKVQDEYVETPKSVSGMTSILLPNIVHDFPDFHFEEMRERAEKILMAYLLSVHEGRVNLPDYANTDLEYQLEQHIQMLENNNQREHFLAASIHECQISNYTREKGKCCVTFQASIQYNHYIQDEVNRVVLGNQTVLEQSRYDIDLIYIQNREIVENVKDKSLGLTCPSCGAAITNLGQKFCEYCGTGIVELNINAWSFSDVRENK